MRRTGKMRMLCTLALAGVMSFAALGAHAQCGRAPAEHPETHQETAQELTGGITVSAHNIAKASWALTDRNRATKFQIPAGTSVTITSEQAASSVYIIWDHTPDDWKLVCGDKEITFDRTNSFLHHYTELPEKTTRIELEAEDDMGVVCDVYLFEEGAAPDWVQCWQMPYERADLLVLPTHADDELLFFGGTLPYYAAEKGYRVQVAYLTNHNGEPYRPHEMLNGLWMCGVRAYPVIGSFPDYYSESLDHAMELYDVDEVLSYQTELIRRFKPYVVIGHDTAGEYGHGVHRLNSYGLMQIVNKTADPEWCPESAEKYGVWEIPKLYLHLYPENEIVMDWSVPVKPLGGKTAYQIACEAYKCHVSQQRGFQMGEKDVYGSTRFGLAHTAVGPDVLKNDFFENIVFEEETIHQPEELCREPKPQNSSASSEELQPDETAKMPADGAEQTEQSEPIRFSGVLLAVSGVLMLAFLAQLAVRSKTNKKR